MKIRLSCGARDTVRLPGAADDCDDLVHGVGKPSLVDPSRSAAEVGMAQLAFLEQSQQVDLVDLQVHRVEPRAQKRARVVRAEVGAGAAVADVALAHHALRDLQHGRRIGTVVATIAGVVAFRYLPEPLPELTREELLAEIRAGRVQQVDIEDQDIMTEEDKEDFHVIKGCKLS